MWVKSPDIAISTSYAMIKQSAVKNAVNPLATNKKDSQVNPVNLAIVRGAGERS
jgi:hypothetical protein